jgi:hypothetical protein
MEEEDDWAAVISDVWSAHRAFFDSWRDAGSFRYLSKSNEKIRP